MTHATLAVFGLPGGYEMIIVLIVALLIFGRRLPDVARSVGKSIVEFKKGIKDVKDDIDHEVRLESKPKDSSSTVDKTAATNSHDTPA